MTSKKELRLLVRHLDVTVLEARSWGRGIGLLGARSSPEPAGTSFRGFVASAQIELIVPAVQRAAALLDRARAAGVTQIHGPVVSEETSKELDRRALADAFKDALEKAHVLAGRAGATLGPAVAINERRDESPSGVVYAPAGPLPRLFASEDVYATVAVTFAIS